MQDLKQTPSSVNGEEDIIDASRFTVFDRIHASAMILTAATAASAVSLYYKFQINKLLITKIL